MARLYFVLPGGANEIDTDSTVKTETAERTWRKTLDPQRFLARNLDRETVDVSM
jgi:hypothetical protein